MPIKVGSSIPHLYGIFRLLLPQHKNLAVGLVVAADVELLAGVVPGDARQPPARALRERGGVAGARVLGGEDRLVARLGVGGRDGVVEAVGRLGEGHLGDLVALCRLPVPGAVEGDVQVRRRLVEDAADGRDVRREAQPRRVRHGVARRVVERRVGRHDELRARLERRRVLE